MRVKDDQIDPELRRELERQTGCYLQGWYAGIANKDESACPHESCYDVTRFNQPRYLWFQGYCEGRQYQLGIGP